MLLKHSNPNHFSFGLSYIVTPMILGSFKLNSRHIVSIKILKLKLFKSQNPYTVPVSCITKFGKISYHIIYCRDTIIHDPRITLGSYVKGPNNIICRVWA